MIALSISICTLCGAGGAYFFKKAKITKLDVRSILLNKYLYLGGVGYLVSSLLNIYILKVVPYSICLPLLSITYIWTMVIARAFLKEKITLNKCIGIIFVITGIIVIAL
jgi:uncharacterized membrane protein